MMLYKLTLILNTLRPQSGNLSFYFGLFQGWRRNYNTCSFILWVTELGPACRNLRSRKRSLFRKSQYFRKLAQVFEGEAAAFFHQLVFVSLCVCVCGRWNLESRINRLILFPLCRIHFEETWVCCWCCCHLNNCCSCCKNLTKQFSGKKTSRRNPEVGRA